MRPEELRKLAEELVEDLSRQMFADDSYEALIHCAEKHLLRAFNTTRSSGDGT